MRPLAYKLIGFFGVFEAFTGAVLVLAGVLATVYHAYHSAHFPSASKFHFGLWIGVLAVFVGLCAVFSAGRRVCPPAPYNHSTVQRQAWSLIHIVTGIVCAALVCLGAHYWSWGLYWDTLATTWGDHPDPTWCFNGCLVGGDEADRSTDNNPFWNSWEGECRQLEYAHCVQPPTSIRTTTTWSTVTCPCGTTTAMQTCRPCSLVSDCTINTKFAHFSCARPECHAGVDH